MKATTTKKKAQTIAKQVLHSQRQEVAIVTQKDDDMVGLTNQVISTMQIAMKNPRLDVKKMQGIMDMQMQVMRFQSEIAYNVAMRDCQAEIPAIHGNQRNTNTRSTYADLEAIDRIIKPIYTRHGFSMSFDTRPVEGGKEVICTVRHTKGHKEQHRLDGALDSGGFRGSANKTGIQAAGSTVSYLQRYLTKLIFNVVIIGEDKDGNRDKEEMTEGQAFSERAGAEMSGTVIDGDPLTIRYEELLQKINGGKSKKQRSFFLNQNLNTLRDLSEAGRDDQVNALHAAVDVEA